VLGAAAAAIRLAALCLPLQITLLSVPGSQRCLRDGCNGAAVRADEHGHTASLHGRIDQQAESCGVTSKARFALRLQGPHCPHRARACGLDGCVFVCVCVCVCVCALTRVCPSAFARYNAFAYAGALTHTRIHNTHTHTHIHVRISCIRKRPPPSLSRTRASSLSHTHIYTARGHISQHRRFSVSQRTYKECLRFLKIHFLVKFIFWLFMYFAVHVQGLSVSQVCSCVRCAANIILIVAQI